MQMNLPGGGDRVWWEARKVSGGQNVNVTIVSNVRIYHGA